MAVTYYPNAALLAFANGTFDLDGSTFKAMLLTTAFAGTIDTVVTRADFTPETTGTGYTLGGVTVTGKLLTQDNTNDRAIWTFDPPTFTTVTVAFQFVGIYKSNGGVASGDPVVCWIDTEGAQSVTAMTVIQAVNATGFTAIRQAA